MTDRITPPRRLFAVPPAPTLAAPAGRLPPHDFHIGENNHATIGQLPNFRAMAFHVIGKAPMLTPVIHSDPIGMGVYSLGALIGDAALKLLRPWPLYGRDAFAADPAQSLILDIADGLLPLSPAAEPVRFAFLCRMGEFMDIATHHPGRLVAIIANIDALTNARLTERAREILTTGTDPGAGDLWASDIPGAEGARS
ncbi:MAG: hypothetical protein Q8M11_11685 [Sulfuritalea sp.]|nr:hypothetical protein [Sulfuritalea sp.]MDP1981752.1 hypothetical protein [Sulfuritalea sp.]